MSKPHVKIIGFDPRKIVSTSSFACSECGKHVTPSENYESVQCEHCGAILDGMEWEPPKDIREALEKQKPMPVRNIHWMEKEGLCGDYEVQIGRCPRCKKDLDGDIPGWYCPHCGQRLDWGE